MSGAILQRLTTLTLSVKQLGRLPQFLDLFSPSLPLPSPTVGVTQVPNLFREPYILSGYRPADQDWRCYLLSLFQRHNESLNVWTHLVVGPLLLLRWWANAEALGWSLDATSLPLVLFLLSSLTYLFFSVTAHLLQSHSELTHYIVFFLDYVGVAVYQYGCALGFYFYSSTSEWRDGWTGRLFLPGAAFLGWLSCTGCCFAKARYNRPYPLQRKICQLIPTSLAYAWDISPVVHRLFTVSWSQDLSQVFHLCQIASFLLSAVFFSCPVPECLFPGRCDIVGQGHQIFHVFLSVCTLCQLEALFLGYAGQREVVVEVFGEEKLWLACFSFPALCLICILTALVAIRHKYKQTQEKDL